MRRHIPKEGLAKVKANRDAGGEYFVLTLEVPSSFAQPKAGAFLMLSTGSEPEIPLRRPMAVFDYRTKGGKKQIDILYNVVGKGTQKLTTLAAGAFVSFLGPIGNYFSSPASTENFAIVAGGIGIAPFLLWHRQLSAAHRKKVRVYFGFRNRKQLGIVKAFTSVGARVRCSVDEGGGDFKGNVVDFFKREMEDSKPTKILTCGPERMMRAALDVGHGAGIPVEASLEAKMGCGLGVCLSCVTDWVPGDRAGGYSLVCQDGPIFQVSE